MSIHRYLISSLLLCLTISVSAQWTQDTLSEGRLELAACRLENKLFFAGGFSWSPFGNQKAVDILDLSTNTWSTDTLSEARDEMSAVAYGDRAYFVGSSGNSTITKVLDIYDNGEDKWYQMQLPNATGIKGIAANDNKLFVAGWAYVDVLDLDSNTWKSYELSVPRGDIEAVSVGSKVIFAGGFNDGASNRLNTVDIYDVETGEWSIDSLSQDRSALAAIAYNGKAYFAGGVLDNYDATKTIDIYDEETGEWSVDSLMRKRHSLTAAVLDGKIYFAGGRGFNGQGNYDDIDILNTETGEWTEEKLPRGRFSLAAISSDDAVYFAGGNSSSGDYNGVDIFSPETSAVKVVRPTVEFALFPNPVLDELTIRLHGGARISSLHVYDANGRQVGAFPGEHTAESTISVTDLPVGTYYLHVLSSEGTGIRQFVKGQ